MRQVLRAGVVSSEGFGRSGKPGFGQVRHQARPGPERSGRRVEGPQARRRRLIANIARGCPRGGLGSVPIPVEGPPHGQRPAQEQSRKEEAEAGQEEDRAVVGIAVRTSRSACQADTEEHRQEKPLRVPRVSWSESWCACKYFRRCRFEPALVPPRNLLSRSLPSRPSSRVAPEQDGRRQAATQVLRPPSQLPNSPQTETRDPQSPDRIWRSGMAPRQFACII